MLPIVILGHRLNPDNTPTADQTSRVDTAVAYWKEHGADRIIPCGGITRDRAKSEAEVMREMLIERGVPWEIIVLENESRTTSENIENTVKILGKGAKIALVTSEYHIDNAMEECAYYGLEATPVPAETKDAAYRAEQKKMCDTFTVMKKAMRAEAAKNGCTEREYMEKMRNEAGSEEAFRAMMRKKMEEFGICL